METQTALCKSFIYRFGRIVSNAVLLASRHADSWKPFWIVLAGFVPFTCATMAQAAIYEWEWIDPADQTLGKFESGALCPDGAGVSAVPFADLSSRDLTQAYLIGVDLTSANLRSSILANADLSGANLTRSRVLYSDLTGANFTDAIVVRAEFSYANLSADQLYSTASYQTNDLQGISLGGGGAQNANLAGWNFSSQNLTSAGLTYSNLAGAVFTGATVSQARFSNSNLTAAQLSSTGSYQAKDLHGMGLRSNNMAGWNFAAQNLTGADMRWATLTGANFAGANVTGTRLNGSNLAPEQLYNTASYQAGNLLDIAFPNDVSGWDFTGQDLTNASFMNGTLTNANFSGAIIAEGEFSYSNLTASQLYSTASYQVGDLHGFSLRNRDLSGWDLSGQDLSSGLFQASTLRHASLVGANLSFAGLYDADLMGADFSGATLTATNFRRSNLMGADFSGATLTGADFSRSDLRGATVEDLASAITTRTIMPDGSVTTLEHQEIRNSDQDIPIRVLEGLSLDSNSWLQFTLDEQPWHSTVSCEPGTSALLGGQLFLAFDQSIPPSSYAGRTYKLFDWSQVGPSGVFDAIFVVGLNSPYGVETSRLYTTGEITIVPEPSAFVLLGLAGVGVLVYAWWRRKRVSPSRRGGGRADSGPPPLKKETRTTRLFPDGSRVRPLERTRKAGPRSLSRGAHAESLTERNRENLCVLEMKP